jgi:TusA-related sulfurtransferase
VLTDDPMAPIDVPHMCRQEGFEIVSLQERGSVIEFILRRPG